MKRVGILIGVVVFVGVILILRSSSGLVAAGEHGAQKGIGTSLPAIVGSPSPEKKILDSELARIGHLDLKETAEEMKRLDENELSPELLSKLNAGSASERDRKEIGSAFAKKNALFGRWTKLKLDHLQRQVRALESNRAARAHAAMEDLNSIRRRE